LPLPEIIKRTEGNNLSSTDCLGTGFRLEAARFAADEFNRRFSVLIRILSRIRNPLCVTLLKRMEAAVKDYAGLVGMMIDERAGCLLGRIAPKRR